MAGKVTRLRGIVERISTSPGPENVRANLTPLAGDEQRQFPLIDPALLERARFGYRQGVPWIVGNQDALGGLQAIPEKSIDCVVTSPPYYWQREYGVEGQTGQEDTVEEYVAKLVAVFAEVRRLLKPRGTVFLVIGDTYYSGKGQPKGGDRKQVWRGVARDKYRAVDKPGFGVPKKSLLGIPWRVALALQADGWTLRSAVIWVKPKTLAEPSVRDRPRTTSETVFILAKGRDYHFDRGGLAGEEDVWHIPAPPGSKRFRHAAPFPEALVERCLAAGCPADGIVLDPYAGSGTTLAVAARRGHPSIGIELNPQYCKLVAERLIIKSAGR
jgi:DNA modification methylase